MQIARGAKALAGYGTLNGTPDWIKELGKTALDATKGVITTKAQQATAPKTPANTAPQVIVREVEAPRTGLWGWVQDNPGPAVATAAAIGIGIAMFWPRRR